MNYDNRTPGGGAQRICFGTTTPISIVGQTNTSDPSIFGDITHNKPSSQQSNANAGPQNLVFGSQSTFPKVNSGLPVFGSVHIGANLFGQGESQFDKDSFTSIESKRISFGKTSFNLNNTQTITTHSQTVFGALSSQPSTVSRSSSNFAFGDCDMPRIFSCRSSNFPLDSKPPTTVFGSLTSSKSMSSNNIYGVHGNPSSSNIFAKSININVKCSQPADAVGGCRLGYRGEGVRSEEETSLRQNILKGHGLSSRNTEGLSKIEVLNIPDNMFNKSSLLQHFSKYGKIIKMATRNFRGCNAAILAFETLEGAKSAKENGCIVDGSSEPLIINSKVGTVQESLQARTNKREQMFCQLENFNQESANRTQFLTEANNISKDSNRIVMGELAAGGDDGNGPLDAVRSKQVESSGPPQLSSRHPEEHTLKSLASIRAINSEERFKILEQRDKIIRNTTHKNADLTTSEVIKGICTDMCPEKERYMRECRRRLSLFEMVPGTDLPGQNPLVDHSRAVKEYSRSSADQEMPLPSELRPPHVLNMTMDYLLSRIMDKGCIGLWAEWYDFLWNRMRAIRKDITQQMLCDVTSVELVEKSARFHILCSELLCEEDPGVFDQKINSENLTKCLQTLKELYHDLYVKHGIVCQNEAEFRGYMVLMNINSAGDILREAQQWRPEVRQSKAFKSSMRTYSSVTSNNYIKFFKLVKQASYLDSCILHRYFNQVRSVAVTRIAKAFNSPASSYAIAYPFRDLINHLGFESSEDAAAFLGQFGLAVSNGQITSDNKQGKVAEIEGTVLPLKRSARLVGSKVRTSLGEIVNGGPLSTSPARTTQSSFNEEGYLVLDEVEASTFVHPMAISVPQVSIEHAAIPVRQGSSGPGWQTMSKPRPNLTKKVVCEILNCIILEVTGSLAREVSESTFEDSHRFLLLSELSGEAVLKETVEECARECSVETINQIKRDNEIISRLSIQTAVQICDEVVQSEVQSICMDSFSSAWSADTEIRIENATSLLASELVNEVVNTESSSYCHQYYRSHIKNVLNGFDSLQAKEKKGLLHRMWKNWLTATKQKQIDRLFPSTVNLHQTSEEVFQAMFPKSKCDEASDFLPLHGSFGVSLLSADEIVARQEGIVVELKKEELNTMERKKFCWSPLHIFEMVKNNLCRKIKQCGSSKMFWKLIISLPADGCILTYKRKVFVKWLARKFQMSDSDRVLENGEDLCFLHSQSVVMPKLEDFASTHCVSLDVCIRSISDISNGPDLSGSTSIIFFIQDHSGDHCDRQLLEMEAHRLLKLLNAKPVGSTLSIVVMGSLKGRDWTISFVTERLRLRNHQMDELIESYHVVMCDGMCVNDEETSHKLEYSIEWLLQKFPQPPPLCTRTVAEYFEENLNQFFTGPVLKTLNRKKEFCLADLPFSYLVKFYNNVARWLVKIVTASQLNSVSWPPNECCNKFKDLPSPFWNTIENLNSLEKYLCELILLPECSAIEDCNAQNMFDKLSDYIKLVANDSKSSWKLITKINTLLDKMNLEAGSRKRSTSKRRSLEAPQMSPSHLPQTFIVLACIDFRLSELFDAKDPYDGRPLSVTYFTNMLSEEEVPLLDLTSPLHKMLDGLKENIFNPENVVLELSPHFSNGSNQFFQSTKEDFLNLRNQEVDFLFNQVDLEKEASKSFQRFLEDALADKSVENGCKSKRAKLNDDSSSPSLYSSTLPEASPPRMPLMSNEVLPLHKDIQDEITHLNFKIKQESRAFELLDLKAKLLLNELP